MTGVLIREDERTHTQGEGHVKTEAEVGAMRPQARDHLRPPGAGRGKGGSSPGVSRGSVAPLAC